MTAWNLLIANSSAPNGSTAWMHLNSQSSGGSTIIGGKLTADFSRSVSADIGISLSTNLNAEILSADMELSLSASSEQQLLEANICQV